MRAENSTRSGIPSTVSKSVDAWFTPGRFAALLAILILIFFPDVILGTRTFVFRDYGLYGYPVAFYHRESFWRGEVPLWNPLSACGIPFLAEWSTLVLYPFSFLYLLSPLSWSLGVFCLAHLILAGLGMYFLAHRWTASRLAASVAGLAFAFNGFSLNSLIWPHYTASLGWMPWVLLTAEHAWQQGGRFVIAAAVVGTLQMLAGPPEVILTTWLLAGALWIGQCVFGKLPPWTLLKRFLFLVLTISGLSAAQLFPFFEFLLHSQRDAGYSTSGWSMAPTGWANLLVPLFYCSKTTAGPYMPYGQALTSSYYLGIGVLALAFFAVGRLREWKIWLLGAIAALGLILALGDAGYLYGFFRRVLPQIGFMRYPVKFVMLTTFAVPLLAACGVRKLLCETGEDSSRSWRFFTALWVTMLGLIFLIVWFAFYYPAGEEGWAATARNGLERAGLLSLIVGVVYRLSRIENLRKQGVFGFILLVVIWLDVATHTAPQNPTVARTVYEPGLQPLQDLKPKPKLGESRAMVSFSARFRFHFTMLSDPFNTYLGVRLGQFSDLNLLDGLPNVDGFYSLYVKEEYETRSMLYFSTNTLPQNYFDKEFMARGIPYISTNYVTSLADFLGVSQITAPGKLFDWEARPTYMPLLTAGQRPVFLDAAGSLRALLDPAFNPRQVVYLPTDSKPFITLTNQPLVRILSPKFSAHRVAFETEADQPSMVVAAQTFYPCWTGYVDGQPTRLWRANHAFQALQVPAGQHQVQLVYRDRNFLAGVTISWITLFGCLAGLVRQRSRNENLAKVQRVPVVCSG